MKLMRDSLFGTFAYILNSIQSTIMNNLNIEKPCMLLASISLLEENVEENIFVQSWKGLQKCKRRSIWIGGRQNGI